MRIFFKTLPYIKQSKVSRKVLIELVRLDGLAPSTKAI